MVKETVAVLDIYMSRKNGKISRYFCMSLIKVKHRRGFIPLMAISLKNLTVTFSRGLILVSSFAVSATATKQFISILKS